MQGKVARKVKTDDGRQVQSDYIKNLQQQIYLLELETRYLKSGKKGVAMGSKAQLGSLGSRNGLSSKLGLSRASMQSMSAIGVPATIDDEEEEDEQVQQLRKQVQDLESNNKHLKTQLETLKTENNELSLEIRSYKERSTQEKDKSYGELMSLKQQYENARAEAQRAEQSYKRVLDEMEQLQGQIAGHNQEQSVLKSRIEEQLAIHGHLKQRLEASQKTVHEQATEIANLTEQLDKKSIGAFEQQIQKLELANRELTAKVAGYDLEKETLVFTRQQAEKEHQNAVRDRTATQQQLQRLEIELEQLKQTKIQERHKSNEQLKADAEREQLLSQLQDDMKMLKIASDTKDETLQTHLQRIKQLELQLLKLQETKANQVDRIQELDQRIRNQSQQLVELGQDKRLLMDEVADLRNQLDTTSHKFKIVSEQHKEAKQALDKAQKEATKFKEFTSILDQVETNGQNYLSMMKEMRMQLSQ